MNAPLGRRHQVKAGENLATIATRYGFRDWQTIYWHPSNARFRRSRPDPNVVRVNDVIQIPLTPEQARKFLVSKIAAFRKIRTDVEQLHRDCAGQLDSQLAEIVRVGNNVDAAATIALILKALAGLVKKGAEAVSKSGEELIKANNEVAKDGVRFAFDPARDAVLQQLTQAVKPETGAHTMLLLVGKAVVESYFDVQSPSFWANVFTQLRDGKSWSQAVSRRPEDVTREARTRLQHAHQQALAAIDSKVRDAEQALRQLSDQETRTYYLP